MDSSKKLLTKLSEQVPGVIYQYQQFSDGTSCFPFSSEGIREIYEVTPEEVKHDATKVIERIHPDDKDEVLASIGNSYKSLNDWECEYRVVLPEKGVRWLKGQARPEKISDGSVIWHGYINDITEKKEANKVTLELKRQFQAILDTMPNQIFVKDYDGHIRLVNKAAADYFGLTPEEMIGKTDEDFGIDKKSAEKFLESTRNVIETGTPKFIKEGHSINEKTGKEEWHQASKVPFEYFGSDKRCVLIVVSDITLRKQIEMELNETIGIIGEQNNRLLNFAHIVSHNLRNHAGNISMLLSLYDEEETEEEKEELFGYLVTASEGLNETIKDLNEIVATQTAVEKYLKKLSLKNTYKKIKEILITEINANNVKLIENFQDNLTLEYNPAYLESILLNLLSNAIKYRHPERQPVIKVDAYKNNGQFYFEVSDNGMGIDLKKHGDKLFGMYKTFHGNANAKGIGLFITKNQVESMGGKIEVDSQVNKGTTFKIKLK
ncbi:MAG: PAS domain S-box protein [Balneolaceae bacterium]